MHIVKKMNARSLLNKCSVLFIIIASLAFEREPFMMDKGFPGGAVVKNPPANAGDVRDTDLIPGWGRSPREGNGHCSWDEVLSQQTRPHIAVWPNGSRL